MRRNFIDPVSFRSLNKHLQDVLFILAVSNSVVNPLIYGRYSIPCCRKLMQGTRTTTQRHQLQPQLASLAGRDLPSRVDALRQMTGGLTSSAALRQMTGRLTLSAALSQMTGGLTSSAALKQMTGGLTLSAALREMTGGLPSSAKCKLC